MEIQLHNPWLTYGMGLHRLREAGLLHDTFDSLDERPFTLDQLHEFCNALFIGDKSGIKLPHPRESLTSFFQTLKMLVDEEELQWNPVRKKMMPWIDLKRLEASHHRHHQDREYQRSKSDNSKSPQDPKEAYDKNKDKVVNKWDCLRLLFVYPDSLALLHAIHYNVSFSQFLRGSHQLVRLLRCMNTLVNGKHLMKLHLMGLVVMSSRGY